MMKKFNWGTGIFIFFVFYVGWLAVTLYRSTQIDHHLVVEDYYAKDIAYQTHYDKVKNRERLVRDLYIRYQTDDNKIVLDFGPQKNEIDVIVNLYRPDNKWRDLKKNFNNISEPSIEIDTNDLKSGRWVVKVEWNDGVRSYYKEEGLFINSA
ncbi:MAG: hypothetical protein HKN68_16570 [Saprospiraceae bacterium]|nr:hypothetical protein [Saprospiraceae bacterium]